VYGVHDDRVRVRSVNSVHNGEFGASRTSENPLGAKFAEHLFYEVG